MVSIGQTALVGIISHIIFILLTWRMLSAINLEPFIRKGKVTEARMLLIFITFVIGSGVSNFFLQIVQWSRDLMYLF